MDPVAVINHQPELLAFIAFLIMFSTNSMDSSDTSGISLVSPVAATETAGSRDLDLTGLAPGACCTGIPGMGRTASTGWAGLGGCCCRC